MSFTEMLYREQNKDEWIEKAKKEIREEGFERWWEYQKEMVVSSCGMKYSSGNFAINNTMNLEELYVLASYDDKNFESKNFNDISEGLFDPPQLIRSNNVIYSEKPNSETVKLQSSPYDIKKIEHHVDLPFDNWGDNVHNLPVVTFIPKSKSDVIHIVKWANRHGKRVRCSGYKHTWNKMYSDNNEVLISMIPLEQAEMQQNNIFDHYPQNAHDDNNNDLLNIELLRSPVNSNMTSWSGNDYTMKRDQGLVKVGASVNNESFRKWCIINDIAIPMNVIMVEITLGGSNAPICHGSGINNKTLSDIVYAIEVVDYRGNLRSFNRIQHPEEMEVLSGSFGLCGVIVSITLEINPVSYAVLEPYKPLLNEGIPRSEEMQSKQFDLFRRLVQDYYYNEFFWFPPSDRLWVNCWKNNGKKEDAEEYPSHIETHMHEASSMLGEFANNTLFKLFPLKLQQNIFSHMAMSGLPGPNVKSIDDVDEKITTQIMNGLHFRRGIHNMKVRDYEVEIPIPIDPYRNDSNSNKSKSTPEPRHIPDLQLVSDLWWTAIDLINEYANRGEYPIQVALEMRIMSGSSRVLMAPQRGNEWTCTIEVLTNNNVPQEDWIDFVNKLNEKWLGLPLVKRSEFEGLFCRPHWAKEWDTLTIDGMSSIDYVKKAYLDEIVEFNNTKKALQLDPINMFSNKLFDKVFDIEFYPEHEEPIKLVKNKKYCSCCDCCNII